MGLARFFSSCFLGTFSGRWRGDPSDLEEALREQREAELVRGNSIKTAGNILEREQIAQHGNEQEQCYYSTNDNVLMSS